MNEWINFLFARVVEKTRGLFTSSPRPRERERERESFLLFLTYSANFQFRYWITKLAFLLTKYLHNLSFQHCFVGPVLTARRRWWRSCSRQLRNRFISSTSPATINSSASVTYRCRTLTPIVSECCMCCSVSLCKTEKAFPWHHDFEQWSPDPPLSLSLPLSLLLSLSFFSRFFNSYLKYAVLSKVGENPNFSEFTLLTTETLEHNAGVKDHKWCW